MTELNRGTIFSPEVDRELERPRIYVAIEKRSGSDWFVGVVFGSIESPEFRRGSAGSFSENKVGQIYGEMSEAKMVELEAIIKS